MTLWARAVCGGLGSFAILLQLWPGPMFVSRRLSEHGTWVIVSGALFLSLCCLLGKIEKRGVQIRMLVAAGLLAASSVFVWFEPVKVGGSSATPILESLRIIEPSATP